MALTDNNGHVLTNEDIEAVVKMQKGLLDSNISKLTELIKNTSIKKSLHDKKLFTKLLKYYQQAKKTVKSRMEQALKSEMNYSVENFLENEIVGINQKFMAEYGTMQKSDFELFAYEFCVEQSDENIVRAYRGKDYSNPVRNTEQGYHMTADSFKLTDEPMKDIGELHSYNPYVNRMEHLENARKGNSATLSMNVKAKKKEIADYDAETKNGKWAPDELQARAMKSAEMKEDLDKTLKAIPVFHSAVNYSRENAGKMMFKEQVTFADLYNNLSGINNLLRDEKGGAGKLRYVNISAGKLKGVDSAYLPGKVYKTLITIADAMNKIKDMENPELQKTNAIRTAAFAYQMLVSIHPFEDGNGRTIRLFADSILQTFGLAPHVPFEEEKHLAGTIGTQLDFEDGAEAFRKGIMESEKITSRQKELPGTKILDHVNNGSAEHLQNIFSEAHKAHRLNDSLQYTLFLQSMKRLAILTKAINECKNAHGNSIDIKKFPGEDQRFFKDVCKYIEKDGTVSLQEAGNLLNVLNRHTVKCAKKYTDYKLGQRREEARKKNRDIKFTSDDRRKLIVMSKVLPNNEYRRDLMKLLAPAKAVSAENVQIVK